MFREIVIVLLAVGTCGCYASETAKNGIPKNVPEIPFVENEKQPLSALEVAITKNVVAPQNIENEDKSLAAFTDKITASTTEQTPEQTASEITIENQAPEAIARETETTAASTVPQETISTPSVEQTPEQAAPETVTEDKVLTTTSVATEVPTVSQEIINTSTVERTPEQITPETATTTVETRIIPVASPETVSTPPVAQAPEPTTASQPTVTELPAPATTEITTPLTPPAAPEQTAVVIEEEKAEAGEPEEEEELAPIDTINIEEPKGNWLNKRIYWERAESEYEKISQQSQEIASMSPQYYQQRAELNRSELDKFYISEGVELGELKQIITTALEGLEDAKTRKGSQEEEIKTLTTKLQDKQETLKKMDKQISTVSAIDTALDDDLVMLEKQIGQARIYERQAWDNFKAISRELSDKKARAIYYSMRALKKNVRSIRDYLSGALDDHFKQLIKTARDRIGEIKKAMEQLRSEGIDLKAYAKKLTQPEVCPTPTEEEEPEEVVVESSYIGSIWNSITGGLSSIWDGLLSLIGY